MTNLAHIGLRNALCALAVGALAQQAVADAKCEELASLALPNAKVTLATSVAAGAFVSPAPFSLAPPDQQPDFSGLPSFCRVMVLSTPSADSQIRSEIWLPSNGWNGKLVGAGNGGYSGEIWRPMLIEPLLRGYAAASTDTGHEGSPVDASFALGHPERVIDFGHRAVHEMTVAAKAISAAFYGNAPAKSYWTGCSSGGRQGLMSAQRYPEDYDGVVAGAPANAMTRLSAHGVLLAKQLRASEASMPRSEQIAALHAAVVAACDARDGVRDGVLEDPRGCEFDPAALACKAGRDATCLGPEQLAALQAMYAPARKPSGEVFYSGYPRGSELNWQSFHSGPGVEPIPLITGLFRFITFGDGAWDWRSLDFDADLARAAVAAKDIDATDPNLGAFFARGGKLVQWHGWNDGGISALGSIEYYEQVTKATSLPEALADSYRLFMAPGVHHCRGGEGPDQFDALGTLEAWVERGEAPDRIVASLARDGKTVRTRPWCPYPQVATYRGTGSTDDATNFQCKAP